MSIPGATEPERLVVTIRPSARMLIGPAVLFVLLVGAVMWLTGVLSEAWQLGVTIACAVLLLVVGCALPMLAWLARRTTITSKKIVSQSGLFVRIRTETLHARGYDVTLRQTPAQTLFRCGDLLVRIPGMHEPVVLHDLPHPLLVQSVLNDLVTESAGSSRPLGQNNGTQSTDTTKRFDPDMLDETQAI